MTVKLHAGSALIGAAALALVVLVLGAFQQPVPVEAMGGVARIELQPHPRQMVQIKGDTPYTVPDGAIFVPTAIGSSELQINVRTVVRVDGEQVVEGLSPTGERASMVPLASGLTIRERSTITLDANGGSPSQVPQLRLWGYLVRE